MAWWPQPAASDVRFTREQYDRIKVGMSEEGILSMLGPRTDDPEHPNPHLGGQFVALDPWEWDLIDEVSPDRPPAPGQHGDMWCDRSYRIQVSFIDGRVAGKSFNVRLPRWRIVAREWLDWLHGLSIQ
jgi:hypothetical protein